MGYMIRNTSLATRTAKGISMEEAQVRIDLSPHTEMPLFFRP
jgi:hypothetical protein